MSVIHESDGKMTRYDLGGEVIAAARHHADGWVIYDRDGGHSDPVKDQDEARAILAAWDHRKAARTDLQRFAASYKHSREHLEQAIRRAHQAGVPQTQIAADSGFSRQWIRHLLQRP